ncbi:ATP-grasp fold amidoligase family protein [Nissabacter sp. SGAir0207]|uniref:ATP-grasp fold amidoligase family protein n=1 Tax=Nissabacter sp. SGAir0207 TaxID=2126321 RepID=UPI00143D5EB3|nr:ATP-grasp fold amidoligase family protein [Nissabacter sp. SGAir0207]
MKKIARLIFNKMPWSVRDNVEFYRRFGRFPNISQPKSFNEKVIHRKRYACLSDENFPMLADKYRVREYVAKRVGEEYLIPLLAHYDDVQRFSQDIGTLENCVVKPNHGAGMVKLISHKPQKQEADEIVQEAARWLKTDFSKTCGEYHYSKIDRKILVEKRIGNGVSALTDYKFHLFRQPDGSIFYVLQLIDDRFEGELSRTFYVNDLSTVYSGKNALDSQLMPLVEKGLALSIELLGYLEYARVDWYIDGGKLYFGEITLTPAAGFGTGYGETLDSLMGDKWHLQAPQARPREAEFA